MLYMKNLGFKVSNDSTVPSGLLCGLPFMSVVLQTLIDNLVFTDERTKRL